MSSVRHQVWLAAVVLAVAVVASGCGGGGGSPAGSVEPEDGVGGSVEPEGGVEATVSPEPVVSTASLYPGLGRLDAPEGVFVDVAVGGFSSCGIRDNGRVVCWGYDRAVDYAPLDGEFLAVEVWQSPDSYYLEDHVCALRSDKVVVCWGLRLDDAGAAQVVAAADSGEARRWELRTAGGSAWSEGFVDIAAGPAGVCGMRADGLAACWSGKEPAEGRVASLVVDYEVCALHPGGGFDCSGGEPAAVLPQGAFADASAGLAYGCGVRPGGELECWGDNQHGQADPPEGRYTQVSAGVDHACALDTGGQAVCWGDNSYGKADPPNGEFAQVSARWSVSSCGLRPGGEQVCWGGSKRLYEIPADIHQFCERRHDEQVCWDADLSVANGDFGDLGASHGDRQLAHIVAFGEELVCGLRPDQSVVCWGKFFGQLSDVPEGTFARLFDGRPWKHQHELEFCGLRPDQSVECWAYDRLSDDSMTGQTTQIGPMTMSSPDGRFADVDGRGRCGVSADGGEVSCWSFDMTGLVGDPPASALPLVRVSASAGVFCGVSAAGGAVVCWPWDRRAAIALDSRFESGFADVAVGPSGAVCAIGTGRDMVCSGRFADVGEDFWSGHYVVNSGWDPVGLGFGGEPFHGAGDKVDPPAGQYTAVDVGPRHACAITATGRAVCWGHSHDQPYHWDIDRVCTVEKHGGCPG
ncbi:hypothetical protein [Candidatus Poriferisocius sp.]|uniref:hypothetical protein n=1 Tax=Candidatus Poriferisocius sp. TaxID=3101276 RepID=UPI003B02DBAD